MSSDFRRQFEERAATLKNLDEANKGFTEKTGIEPTLIEQSQPTTTATKPSFKEMFEQRAAKLKEEDRIKSPAEYAEIGINKGGRLAGQFLTGAVEGATLPYSLGTMAAKGIGELSAPQQFRQDIGDEIESLLEKKATGKWSPEDQANYDYFANLIKNPRTAKTFTDKVKIPSFDTGSLIEQGSKFLGVDLTPKDIYEQTARIGGFFSNPYKATELLMNPSSPANAAKIIKEILPTAKEAVRSAAIAGALDYAAREELGPIGTLSAALITDIATSSTKGTLKALGKTIAHPVEATKKIAAQVALIPSRIANNKQKIETQKALIKSLREAGVQADAGTILNSNIMKQTQSVLAQSSLTGKNFDEFRNNLLNNITSQYKDVADALGTQRFMNSYDLGEAVKDAAKVEDTYLGFFKPPKGYKGRSLVNRIDVQQEPTLGNAQQEFLHSISPVPFESDVQAGTELRTEAQNIERRHRRQFRREYSDLSSRISNIPMAPAARLSRTVSSLIEDIGGTMLPGASPVESKFMNTLNRLDSQLSAEGGLHGVSLDTLIKTKKTLGEIPNWEVSGSRINRQFQSLYHELDSAIRERLQAVDMDTYRLYNDLNEKFSNFMNTFGSRQAKPLFQRKNVKLAQSFRSGLNQDNLLAYERILSSTPKGQDLINQLKRDFVQSKFKTRQMTPRELSNLTPILGERHAQAREAFTQAHENIHARRGRPAIPTEQVGAENVPRPTFNAWIPEKMLTGRVAESEIQKAKEFFKQIKSKTPEMISNKINSVSGLRELRRILAKTPDGRELYNQIARYKLDEIFNAHFKAGMDLQLKTGSFPKIMDNPKNRAILQELIPPNAFAKFDKIARATRELSNASNKFYNASQTAVRHGDTLVAYKVLKDAVSLFHGNPWPFVKTAGTLGFGQYLSKLLTDDSFLRLLEEAMLTSNPVSIKSIGSKIAQKAIAVEPRLLELVYTTEKPRKER